MSSHSLFERALKIIPGGVNSPVRAFKSVGGEPRFITRGSECYLFDVDDRRYIDYVGSWGPLLLGHRHPIVEEAIETALKKGTSFGAPTELEVELAEFLVNNLPGIEMIRMVNSGTEATMSAVRLARGVTGRDNIIKFNGCYHGHADSFLVAAGSGVASLGIAGSPGVPSEIVKLTASIEFNNLEVLEQTVREIGASKIAAIILEPVAGNMGLILPAEGYLSGVRSICDRHGILLIFDEVMSGFRVAFGGAAERFGVIPDLTTFGKIIGGGLPVGAFGGRREIMAQLAPSGPVYQAGTLSGNPLAMAAGLATLKVLKETDPYPALEELAGRWVSGIELAGRRADKKLLARSCGAMLGLCFADRYPTNFSEAKGCDVALFNKFFHGMLEQGVYFAPSAFEANFLSIRHTAAIIDETISAVERVLATL